MDAARDASTPPTDGGTTPEASVDVDANRGVDANVVDGNTPFDAGEDANANDASSPDATTPVDAATDASELPDGNTPIDGSTPLDASTNPDAADGATDPCAALLSKMLSSNIVPQNQWAGWDLLMGANPKGLTVDEANALGCGTPVVEATPSNPGYRTMTWGPNKDVMFAYNLQSHVVRNVQVSGAYTGTVTFKSRDGSHTYVLGIGTLKRDGVDFPISFTWPSASLMEIYNGLMATFVPNSVDSTDCRADGTCLVFPDDGVGESIFGVRPIHFYFGVNIGVSQPKYIYNVWPGGVADCSTPNAQLELMDYFYIAPADGYDYSVGGLQIWKPGTNPSGMTWQEAQTIDCTGTMATPVDPGYGAIQWGPSGEVYLEYNAGTGANKDVAYKLMAKSGYKGTFYFTSADGTHTYQIGIGSITKDNMPFTIDWTSAATANPAVTELSNAAYSWYSGTAVTDADCVASGNCTITPDDGNGSSVFGFTQLPEVDFVSPKGTSAPSTITVVWAAGQ
jgi:hypothetical protein